MSLTDFLQTGIDVGTRTICLFGGIDQEAAALLVKGLHLLGRGSRANQEVLILLNSEGGDVTAGLAMVDAIALFPGPVTVRVLGTAQSMAAIVLQAATTRQIAANATLMVHQGTVSPPEEHLTSVKAWLAAAEREDRVCDSLLLRRIREKHPAYRYSDVRELTEFDSFFTADEALTLGLVDEVLSE